MVKMNDMSFLRSCGGPDPVCDLRQLFHDAVGPLLRMVKFFLMYQEVIAAKVNLPCCVGSHGSVCRTILFVAAVPD